MTECAQFVASLLHSGHHTAAKKVYDLDKTSRLTAPSTASPAVTPETPLTKWLLLQTVLPFSVTVVVAGLIEAGTTTVPAVFAGSSMFKLKITLSFFFDY